MNTVDSSTVVVGGRCLPPRKAVYAVSTASAHHEGRVKTEEEEEEDDRSCLVESPSGGRRGKVSMRRREDHEAVVAPTAVKSRHEDSTACRRRPRRLYPSALFFECPRPNVFEPRYKEEWRNTDSNTDRAISSSSESEEREVVRPATALPSPTLREVAALDRSSPPPSRITMTRRADNVKRNPPPPSASSPPAAHPERNGRVNRRSRSNPKRQCTFQPKINANSKRLVRQRTSRCTAQGGTERGSEVAVDKDKDRTSDAEASFLFYDHTFLRPKENSASDSPHHRKKGDPSPSLPPPASQGKQGTLPKGFEEAVRRMTEARCPERAMSLSSAAPPRPTATTKPLNTTTVPKPFRFRLEERTNRRKEPPPSSSLSQSGPASPPVEKENKENVSPLTPAKYSMRRRDRPGRYTEEEVEGKDTTTTPPVLNPLDSDSDKNPIVLYVDVELPDYYGGESLEMGEREEDESRVVRIAVRRFDSPNLLTFYFSQKYKLNVQDSILLQEKLITEMSRCVPLL